MRPSLRLALACIAVGIATYACSADAPSDPTNAQRPGVAPNLATASAGQVRTIDDDYADLTDRLPGFGGMFYDDNGRLTVHMKDPSSLGDPAKDVLTAFLDAHFNGTHSKDLATMQVLPADYDFKQLLTLYRTAVVPRLPDLDGGTTGDVDERLNRIVIGVSDESHLERATTWLSSLAVPNGSVQLAIQPPVEPTSLLTDSLIPTPGGAAITIAVPGATDSCSMGYNLIKYVYASWDSAVTDRYFVTASHCGTARGHVDNDQVRQSGYYIGLEILDPPTFTSATTTSCMSGKVCRWTDAAIFQYDSPSKSDQGHVAYPAVGSTSFSSYMTITAVQSVMAGYTVNMVGYKSGRTYGTINHSCVDVWGITGWTNGELLCQGDGAYTSQNGDSGAPVVTLFGDGTAWATGLHWGNAHNANGSFKNSWFSPMQGVINEMYATAGSPNFSPVIYP